jgi:hypothetical protein
MWRVELDQDKSDASPGYRSGRAEAGGVWRAGAGAAADADAPGFRAREAVGSGSKNGLTAAGLFDECRVDRFVFDRHSLR